MQYRLMLEAYVYGVGQLMVVIVNQEMASVPNVTILFLVLVLHVMYVI